MDKKSTILILVILASVILVSGCFGQKSTIPKAKTAQPNITQEIPAIPGEFQEEARARLSQIKIASHYERITDGSEIPRSIDEVANIFKETKTELVFRSFWRWNPVPESPSDKIPGIPDSLIKEAADAGYTYKQYSDAAGTIKEKMPDILLVGAISAQRVNKLEINPISRDILEQDKTWDMAFDPGKWNLSVSKEETQCKMTKSWNWIGSGIECPSGYNPENAAAYFPDITDEKYEELLLSLAKKQIDSGADAIWIDMLFYQANFIAKNTNNPNHPAVKAAFEASSKIVDEIHNYGYSKGKYIYVGTWSTFIDLPYAPPDVDFVTVTPTSEEVNAEKINEAGWISTREKINATMGNIPIFVFIDHGNDGLPLAVFSQKLTSKEQNEFLKYADKFFTENGMVFVYPIHGGFMGQSAKILAFGKLKNYDALAPEFNTYGTIKELANKK